MAIKELTVEQWFTDIKRGLDFRRAFGYEEEWPNTESRYYATDESAISSGPNLLLSTGDALLSTLCTPNPVYSCDAKTQETVNKASVLEAILNQLLDQMDVANVVESMCQHTYLFGTGIMKVGYDSEFGYAPEFDIGTRDDPAGATLTSVAANGMQIEFGANGPGTPWVAPVMPHDFVVPYGTTKLKDAQWAVHRLIRHIDEIKADPKYKKTKNLQPNMSMEDFVKSYSNDTKPYRMGTTASAMSSMNVVKGGNNAPEYVELWEIHDRQTRKVYVIATGYDEFLRDEEDAMQIGGHLPFIDLSFVSRTRSIWTTPDAVYLMPHQAELTDIHMQSDKQRRTSVAKYAVNPDAFEEDELDRLTTADVGAVIRTKNRDAVGSIMVLPQSNNQGLYQDANFVEEAAQKMVGFSNNQFGEYDSSSRRSATEAQIVAQASNQRMSRRQTAVRDVYVRLARILQPIIFNFMTAERVIKYVGQDGVERWTPYHGDALTGDYSVKVSFYNEGEPTPTQKKQSAVQQAMLAAQLGADPKEVLAYAVQAQNNPALSKAFGNALMQGNPNAQQPPQGPQGPQPQAPQGPVGPAQ